VAGPEATEEPDELERSHPHGMSVHQIVAACAANGDRLTEATFRKYVQLGLLPRSVRVGKKGKHRGSQGLYPASIVRQVQRLRKLMAQGFTIDEIQSRSLVVGSEVGALVREIERVIAQLERAPQTGDSLVKRELEEARRLSTSLVEKLWAVERRLSLQARMERAAV
jgi:DNA-binding transcriptional MerR regulator